MLPQKVFAGTDSSGHGTHVVYATPKPVKISPQDRPVHRSVKINGIDPVPCFDNILRHVQVKQVFDCKSRRTSRLSKLCGLSKSNYPQSL